MGPGNTAWMSPQSNPEGEERGVLGERGKSCLGRLSSVYTTKRLARKGKMRSVKSLLLPMYTAALLTTAKTWKPPKWPSTDEWMKRWYIYNGILLSQKKGMK